MDYTIIEINENEDNIHHFLTLDDRIRIFENNCSNECYLNENIIIFAINKNNKEISFSNGIIKKCYDYYFSYNSITCKGCSGGCIINQNNGKVIGFHKGTTKKGDNDDSKAGIFLMDIIKQQKLSEDNAKKEYELPKNIQKEQEPIQKNKEVLIQLETKKNLEEDSNKSEEKEEQLIKKKKEIKEEKESQKIKEEDERRKRIIEAIKKKQ